MDTTTAPTKRAKKRSNRPREESSKKKPRPPGKQHHRFKKNWVPTGLGGGTGGQYQARQRKGPANFPPVVPVGAKVDPRFFGQYGDDFDRIRFRRDYAFLDDMRTKEIGELKKAHRTARRQDPEMAKKIKENLRRLENQERSTNMQKLEEETRAELRQTNIDRMHQGLKPLYLNTNEMKRRVAEKRFEQLKEQGKLEEHLEKQAKRRK